MRQRAELEQDRQRAEDKAAREAIKDVRTLLAKVPQAGSSVVKGTRA
jgi:hypothetical protein